MVQPRAVLVVRRVTDGGAAGQHEREREGEHGGQHGDEQRLREAQPAAGDVSCSPGGEAA